MTELKQLLEIFPNVKKLNLNSSKIEGAWPSSHYTNLRSFNDTERYSVLESKIIPLSLNGYQELECKPELMIRGIQDAKFQPLNILKLNLNMEFCHIDCK